MPNNKYWTNAPTTQQILIPMWVPLLLEYRSTLFRWAISNHRWILVINSSLLLFGLENLVVYTLKAKLYRLGPVWCGVLTGGGAICTTLMETWVPSRHHFLCDGSTAIEGRWYSLKPMINITMSLQDLNGNEWFTWIFVVAQEQVMQNVITAHLKLSH